MDKFYFKNEYGEIEFSKDSPYILTDFAESTQNNVVSSKQVGRDGEVFASSTLGVRQIKLEVTMVNNAFAEEKLRELTRVLNPKLESTLLSETLLEKREITVELDSLPEVEKTMGKVVVKIELAAYFPYWTEQEIFQYLAMLKGTALFPLVIPVDKGIIFGIRESVLETKILNAGDVPSGFRVVFKSKGEVQNPYVEHKLTGKKIRILTPMHKNDELEVINYPNRKMVYLNGVKAFHLLDRNSEFFALDVGHNLLGYNADLNTMNLDVYVFYSPLYLGR